jgi:hypothetical protein
MKANESFDNPPVHLNEVVKANQGPAAPQNQESETSSSEAKEQTPRVDHCGSREAPLGASEEVMDADSKLKEEPRVKRDNTSGNVREVNPALMEHFKQRSEEPELCETAVRRCMLVIAQLRSHDPLLVRKATGYPLDFTRRVVCFLLGNKDWIGWSGYVGLLCSLDDYPQSDEVFDECAQISEWMRTDPCWAVVEHEWKRYDSVAITNEFAERL